MRQCVFGLVCTQWPPDSSALQKCGMKHLRSPASVAVCRRQAAQTGIGGGFRLHDRFRFPAADALTRAVTRARPGAGREVCADPKNKQHPRCRHSTSRVFSSYVNSPHIFVQYCLEMAGDQWSPLQQNKRIGRKIKHIFEQCTHNLCVQISPRFCRGDQWSPALHLLHLQNQDCILCILSFTQSPIRRERPSLPPSQKVLDRGSGRRPRIPASPASLRQDAV